MFQNPFLDIITVVVLHHIQEIPDSTFSPKTCPDWGFDGFPQMPE
jgi:hypothetical protein